MKDIRTVYLLITLALISGCQGVRRPEEQAANGERFEVYPIGRVQKKDARTFIVIDKAYEPGLKGLERHNYVHVVYWFDRNDTPEKRAILQVHPRADKKNPLTGVFATHSPFRPNLIAISRCDIIGVEQNIIEIKDIDAFDGSPVLDLKGDFFRFANSNRSRPTRPLILNVVPDIRCPKIRPNASDSPYSIPTI